MASCRWRLAQLIPRCAAPLAAYALFGRFLPRLEAAVETPAASFFAPCESSNAVLPRPVGKRVGASTLAGFSERSSVPRADCHSGPEWGKHPGETPQSKGDRDEHGIGDG